MDAFGGEHLTDTASVPSTPTPAVRGPYTRSIVCDSRCSVRAPPPGCGFAQAERRDSRRSKSGKSVLTWSDQWSVGRRSSEIRALLCSEIFSLDSIRQPLKRQAATAARSKSREYVPCIAIRIIASHTRSEGAPHGQSRECREESPGERRLLPRPTPVRPTAYPAAAPEPDLAPADSADG